MDINIKHKFQDAEIYKKSVVENPIPSHIFIQHLREGIKMIYASKRNTFRNAQRMYINMMEHYLEKYNIKDVIPDEKFFEELWNRVMQDGMLNGRIYSVHSRKKVARATRRLVNDYFYAKGLVQRKVLLGIARQRYERFHTLTKNTQRAIVWFEQHGKVVKTIPVYVESKGKSKKGEVKRIHRVTERLLLPGANANKIQQAMLFLRIIDKNGFEFVCKGDDKKLEEYCDQRKLKKKQDFLADVATVLINLLEAGFIKNNPFAHVSLKKDTYSSVKNEFLSAEAVEKIRDLSTVNFNAMLDVRDRLAALLGYDLAMRLNEFLSLKVSDIQKDADGEMYVRLRPEIQKGRKNEDVMYFFFDETKKLLDIYLSKTRKKFLPETDYLILSRTGGQLNSQHCRKQFKNLCEKLQIKTFYGNIPAPHCLRHSFATLNIEPLGLSLPLSEIMRRLRHTRPEIAERHYIHDNPYLKKLKHTVYRKRIRKQTIADKLNEVPLADLEHWLSDTLQIDSATIKSIRACHKKALSQPAVDKNEKDITIYVAEDEALSKLHHLGIMRRSLRQYAFEKGAIKDGYSGTIRYGAGYKYKEDFVTELSKNWVPAENLRVKLKLPPRTFQFVVKKEKWRTIKIGRNRFIHREDCV